MQERNKDRELTFHDRSVTYVARKLLSTKLTELLEDQEFAAKILTYDVAKRLRIIHRKYDVTEINRRRAELDMFIKGIIDHNPSKQITDIREIYLERIRFLQKGQESPENVVRGVGDVAHESVCSRRWLLTTIILSDKRWIC